MRYGVLLASLVACGGGGSGGNAMSDAQVLDSPIDAGHPKVITSFAFLKANNPGLAKDVTAEITDANIAARTPIGTAREALVATFTFEGVDVRVMGALQTTGVTEHDYSSPIQFVVTADDGTEQAYTVAVQNQLFVRYDTTGGFRPAAIAFADLDNDGLRDLVIGNNHIDLRRNGTTAGSPPVFAAANSIAFDVGGNAYETVTADWNGDGNVDIATANNTIFIGTNVTNGASLAVAHSRPFPNLAGVIAIATGDLNADGKPDLAGVRGATGDTLVIALDTTPQGAITPTFTSPVFFATRPTPQTVQVGDIDGDGKPDVIVSNNGEATVSVFPNTTAANATTPTFGPRVDFPMFIPGHLVLADINSDGKLDIVVNAETMSILLNTTPSASMPPTFADHVDIETVCVSTPIAAADIDGDGRVDLVAGSSSACPDGHISLFLNTTPVGAVAPTFAARIDLANQNELDHLAIGDLDNDGRLDIAATDHGTGSSDGGIVLLMQR